MRQVLVMVCFAATVEALGCSESFKPSETDAGQDTAVDTGSEVATDPEPDTAVDTGGDVVEDPLLDIDLDLPPGPCLSDDDCMPGLSCCATRCVNLRYDPDNCSSCGTTCGIGSRFCADGMCTTPPCDSGTACTGITTCCGSDCCLLTGEVCCIVEGPGPVGGPSCHIGFCPGGCPSCE